MRINEIISEWIAMPHTAKSMGLRKANSHWMPINVGNNKANEKAPPGREKQVRALKGKVDNPYEVAWASYNKSKGKKESVKEGEADDRAQASIWHKKNPIGRNWMNPDDYDSDAPGTHIIAYTPTEQHMYKVPAKNYDEAHDKWLNDRDSNNPRDSQYYDSTKDYASEQDYWGRIAPENDPMNWPDAQKDDDEDWTDADEKEFGTAQKGEDAMGVGTITKQNTTKDVKPGETQRQLKKLHLK